MIIGLMADKGGVCKTTAAHNMGAELALLDPPVLLVDADKQADLTELCGVQSEPNIGMDAILRQVPTPSARGYIRSVAPGIDLIGTHPQMKGRTGSSPSALGASTCSRRRSGISPPTTATS